MTTYRLADDDTPNASPEAIGNVSFKTPHPVLPSDVPPRTEVPITVQIANNATVISPTDTDSCWTASDGSGYSTELVAIVDGSTRAIETRCFSAGSTDTWDIALPGLSAGEWELTLEIRGKNSGRVADTLTHTITAGEDGGGDDEKDDEENNNTGGFFASLSTDEQLALAGAGAIGLWTFLGDSDGGRTFNLRRR
jgi:hypothetical protein